MVAICVLLKGKQLTHLVDVQGNDISADLRLWRHHGRLLYLFPVGSQVGQPEVVVNKLKPAQTRKNNISASYRRHREWFILKVQHIALQLPFPCAEVDNDEALVLIGVDVMKHANGCPLELVINVLSWVFSCNVKQGL